MNHSIAVGWSVWDNSPVVEWAWRGLVIRRTFSHPPTSVAALDALDLVAVCLSPQNDGGGSLQLFRGNGDLLKSVDAPNLGEDCSFTFAEMSSDRKSCLAAIQFKHHGEWEEQKGVLDLETGELTNLHPIR